MTKKVLPKTPESLFDPIEYERSSRTPSPSPRRPQSRSPTPKISPLRYRGKKQNLPWYERFLISNITFYIFLLLTLILTATVSRNFVPVNYCDGKENIEPDCIECPQNAECLGTKYNCTEGSIPYKDMCIKKNSPNEKAIELIPIIESLIENKTVSNINDFKKLKDFEGITQEQIKVAIHLSDKYILNSNGVSIDARWNRQTINLILYVILAICLIIFILSIFFRVRNQD